MKFQFSDLFYGLGGAGFSGTALFCFRFMFRLTKSGEDIYERRSKSQTETIIGQDKIIENFRKTVEECHQEKIALMVEVENLKQEVQLLRIEVANIAKN